MAVIDRIAELFSPDLLRLRRKIEISNSPEEMLRLHERVLRLENRVDNLERQTILRQRFKIVEKYEDVT